MVRIEPNAEGSDSAQLSQNLMLHDSAVVNTRPQMEIFNEDVKASHGATTGGPAPEAMFYLQARGLGRETATKLYVNSFVSAALLDIEDPALRRRAMKWLQSL